MALAEPDCVKLGVGAALPVPDRVGVASCEDDCVAACEPVGPCDEEEDCELEAAPLEELDWLLVSAAEAEGACVPLPDPLGVVVTLAVAALVPVRDGVLLNVCACVGDALELAD